MRERISISTEPVDEIIKNVIELTKKINAEGFGDGNINEIEELNDSTPMTVVDDNSR